MNCEICGTDRFDFIARVGSREHIACNDCIEKIVEHLRSGAILKKDLETDYHAVIKNMTILEKDYLKIMEENKALKLDIIRIREMLKKVLEQIHE
jgi:hypothetical protein